MKGENIPFAARMLAIADAFDTLRGARPYRPAVSREYARKFLLNGVGTQFDPKIVDIFLRNLQTLEAEVVEQGFSYKFDDQSSNEINKHIDEKTDQSYVEQINAPIVKFSRSTNWQEFSVRGQIYRTRFLYLSKKSENLFLSILVGN